MRYFSILVLVAGVSFTGCTVGPNYHRPPVQIPGTFRAPDPLPPQTAASLADLKWFEVFKDEKLQDLIRTALEQNYDLRAAVTRVAQAGKVVDAVETTFGLRTVEFTVNDGLHLNGKHLPIRGVCNHHDLGALGAAFNVRAAERQLEILREMGVNAIRTSHNPPAPEFLDLCDRMGFLVMAEAFDEWTMGKVSEGYHK